jgi:7-carboxy-7-deazaguanine synthase
LLTSEFFKAKHVAGEQIIQTITMPEPKANLIEIFSAIQGEGLNVGTRQIFVRFGGCDLRCTYCDSEHTWQKQPNCQIEIMPGSRDFETYANPVSGSQLLTWVIGQNLPHLHDSISITGGEPLLHANFLSTWLPAIRSATQLPIYLETGGHRPQQLATIIEHVDLIGMDMKLPSASGEEHWAAHQEFLQICAQRDCPVFVKIVVSKDTVLAELEQAAQIIRSINSQIPLFLQPVTPLEQPHSKAPVAPEPHQVLEWQQFLKQFLIIVRVIPQTHKMIAQR